MYKHPNNYIDKSDGCSACKVKPRNAPYRVIKTEIVCEKCYNKKRKK